MIFLHSFGRHVKHDWNHGRVVVTVNNQTKLAKLLTEVAAVVGKLSQTTLACRQKLLMLRCIKNPLISNPPSFVPSSPMMMRIEEMICCATGGDIDVA